ncbi:hypothetical protein R3W88_013718 [Solanum pinnatisectum]|uniref:Uncharacterized protein n=1 Tax=Solanum pinnatisectum TaxID=50273 RepID=A0AAV9KRW5_9SOLN|nr:hypothetical protein R3W88_013718 [Solanum pinnatisectum]
MHKYRVKNKITSPGVRELVIYMVYTSNIHLVFIMTSENEKGLKAQGNFSSSKGVNGLTHDCWQSGRLRTGGRRANLIGFGAKPKSNYFLSLSYYLYCII